MRTTIDAAGRLVVPKPVRDRLGLRSGQELSVEETEGSLLLTPVVVEPRIEELPDGPVIVAAAGGDAPSLTDEAVRTLLESLRTE